MRDHVPQGHKPAPVVSSHHPTAEALLSRTDGVVVEESKDGVVRPRPRSGLVHRLPRQGCGLSVHTPDTTGMAGGAAIRFWQVEESGRRLDRTSAPATRFMWRLAGHAPGVLSVVDAAPVQGYSNRGLLACGQHGPAFAASPVSRRRTCGFSVWWSQPANLAAPRHCHRRPRTQQ